MSRSNEPSYHYIRYSISPACNDALTVRKHIQDALLQSFGLTSANLQTDILWIDDNGTDVVLRLRPT